jgi:hypothetical protein
VLIVLRGLEVAFAINGLSFLVVVTVLVALVRSANRRAIATTAEVDAAPPKDISADEGWASIARDAVRPLAMDAAISFAAGAMFILPVLVAVAQPGGNDALVGILSAGGGIGGILGALAAGAFVNGRSDQGLIAGVGVAVASLSLLAGSTTPILAVAAVAIVSGAIVQLDTLNMTELQRLSRSGRLGRTLGLLHTLAAAWIMAGSIVAGTLAQALGVGPAVLVCAAVVAVLGGAALCGRRSATPVVSHAPRATGAIAIVGSDA